MSDLSGRLSGGQAISGSLSGGSTLQGGLSMGGVSPAVLLDKADVITDTASGSIVSIPDGMASPVLGLSVDIEPIQDLHGYDNPWAEGGGANKFAIGDAIGVIQGASYNLSVVLDTVNETIHIQGTPNWTSSGSKNFRVVSYVSGNYFGDAPVTHDYSDLTGKWFVVSKSSNVSSINYGTNPASDGTIGIMLSVTDVGSVDIVLKLFLYEGSTAPASWSPYSNLCPISGRSEVNIKRTGTNISGATIRQHNASNIFTTGTLLKAGTYTASFSWSGTFDGMYIRTADDITSPHIAVKYNANAVTFTIDKAETIYVQGLKNGGVTATDVSFQLEPGSNASAYKPYTGEAYTIQLGQTVYGGMVDVTSGKLRINKAIADLTTGMTGGSAGSGYVWYKQLQNALTVPNSQIADIISEAYEPIRYNAIASNVNHVALRDNGIIYINTGSQDVLPVGNVVYALATPVEVTLTAEELDILYGDNNVWADSGDTTVEYRADTKKYILKKIAEALNA